MRARRSSETLVLIAASLAIGVVSVGCGSTPSSEQASNGESVTTLPSDEPTTSLAGEGLGSELADELVEELAGKFLSIGRGDDAVEVVLAPDEEALAAELRDRYGDAVVLSVGRLNYPLDEATSVCPEAPERRSQQDLEIAVVEPDGPISAAGVESLRLSVRLTNVSQSPISFASGSAVGTVFDSSGNVVSSGATSGLTLEEIPVELDPGESTDLPLYASMASCDPDIGFVIPPGEYLIVAEVVRIGGGLVRLHSEPQTIRVGT